MEQNQTSLPAKKTMTKQQKTTLIVVGVLVAIAMAILIPMRMQDNAIVKNGVEVNATSTGQYMQTRSGGKRSHTVYKAQYTFVDSKGQNQFVYGDKQYESKDDIKEGREVTVKYLKDEPNKSVVTAGE